MRTSKTVLTLFFLTASAVYAQQQLTQTVTRENKSCNATCSVIDVPELNNNPAAIIFVTASPNGKSDPHPIGAYYMYLKKWSVYNLDGAAMPEGAQFDVEYYVKPDSDRFLYLVPKAGAPCIDHPGLNGNPSAHIRFFPTGSPSRGALYNRDDIKIEYDVSALKWCIANTNGRALAAETAYNIAVDTAVIKPAMVPSASMAGKPGTNPPCDCPMPASLSPAGNAGGDLGGTYPSPAVQKLLGRPLAGKPPVAGEYLRWDGTQWAPSELTYMINGQQYSIGTNHNVAFDATFGGDLVGNFQTATVKKINGRPVSDSAPAVGQILRWNGTAWEPFTQAAPPPPPLPVRSYFKVANSGTNYAFSDLNGSRASLGLNHTITLAKRSQLVITGVASISGPNCPLGCSPGQGYMFAVVDNTKFPLTYADFVAGSGASVAVSVSNFVIELEAGTHNVDFGIDHIQGRSPFTAYPRYSSVIVIPLE